MANQGNMDKEFEPGCWRYETVRDFRNQTTEEESDDDGDELEPVHYPVELGG